MPDQQNAENNIEYTATDPAVVARIRDMAAIAREHELAELTMTEDGVEITVQLTSRMAVAPLAGPVRPKEAPVEPSDEGPVAEPGTHLVVSPMVGVLYRSPMPDAPLFVNVGDIVTSGDIIGLVEAMKVFNEIACEVSGEVIEILAQNEDFVKVGQPLLKIRID